MGDSYWLRSPLGSFIDLASYIDLERGGPDFGAAGLQQAAFNETPAVDGGVLSYESAGVRRMGFPLVLPSGPGALIRQLARPGAVLDLRLDGVATAEAVRFDLLSGQLEPAYDYRIWNQADRARSDLLLQTQPFGYWPTEILLASAASVGLPGVLAVPGASVIGDVPGLARIVIQPTSPTNYPVGTWVADMVAWSLGGAPSFVSFIPAASISGASVTAPTLIGDLRAPGSQAIEFSSVAGVGVFRNIAYATIGQAVEPAYRGGFRAYAYIRALPSWAGPLQIGLDVAPNRSVAFASAGIVATVPNLGATVESASAIFHLVDLGIVTIPQIGSGISNNHILRLWSAASGITTASAPIARLGGFALMPIQAGGVVARGIAQPSTFAVDQWVASGIAPTVGRVTLDAIRGDAYAANPVVDLASQIPLAAIIHNGRLPEVGATTNRIDILAAARKTQASGATYALMRTAEHSAAVSVVYRPRFTFTKGL